jgi:hypothetical protein
MDHNRRGLALMTAAMLISILVLSFTNFKSSAARKFSDMDRANQNLIARAPTLTKPIRDYQINSIEEGVMSVTAGPSLTRPQLVTLTRELILALHDADHAELGSDFVMVEIKRGGVRVCHGQTTPDGPWVRLDS